MSVRTYEKVIMDSAKSLLQEFIDHEFELLQFQEHDDPNQCFLKCPFCEHFEMSVYGVRLRHHTPDCLIRRASEFLQGMGVGGA